MSGNFLQKIDENVQKMIQHLDMSGAEEIIVLGIFTFIKSLNGRSRA